ncbi:MAG: LD-carboxypeptidase [Lachnospiraceae bacterium]|nr:LD-carboxypeptidase [Lachnospiraceae bacterium]
MRYPEFIHENSCVGFIAPSFGCASLEPYHTRFLEARKTFESAGFQTVVGECVFLEDGIGKSSTPERCGAEINEFFLSDQCDAVLSVGGGETMCEDLGFVDFERIKAAKPKWFMGYSDNTCLNFTLPTICDTAAIYGPNSSSYGAKPLHPYQEDALALLRGEKLTFTNYEAWEKESLATPENPFAALNCMEPYEMSAFVDGRLYTKDVPPLSVTGRMLGGCLDLLCVLCGTKYDKAVEFTKKYDEDGTIFFMESCDLNPLSTFRALWQLRNAGWFRNTKAFLFGRPLFGKETYMGITCQQAVLHVLGDMNVPILFDLDIGHLPPQIPIITGAMATVNAKGNDLSISYRLE